MADTAYFLISKAMKALMTPHALFIAAAFLSFFLLYTRRGAPWGRRLLGLALLGYLAVAIFPAGIWALALLEDRFPVQPHNAGPVAGIIVLGGAVDTVMTRERGLVQLGAGGERMTEFVRLARQHPDATLIFTGGSGRVFDRKPTEAEVARRFFHEMGMDTDRILFEDRSRNTTESAQMALAVAKRQRTEQGASGRWILITSAAHMPRAMGLFRHAGWTDLSAHPVDHFTQPGAPAQWWPTWPGSIGHANKAAYEWGGLIVAYLRGRTETLFPGPSQ